MFNDVIKGLEELVEEIQVLSWRWMMGTRDTPVCLFYEWKWCLEECLQSCSCCFSAANWPLLCAESSTACCVLASLGYGSVWVCYIPLCCFVLAFGEELWN
ncbi:transmembrane protein, putative [Medicago truncatula]|uniref:Transmembrane protein, putative n=1 Tax=Medicago truncatula TaxID=3880 RepID=A0A072TP76_MEDTR|nr:transmembrane protein, putative [Medicago truncatula]